jgi:creatinine amidohydrolase
VSPPLSMAELTTTGLAEILAGPRKVVALVPVGSTEPHGPHLPLSTDVLISEGACRRAASLLAEKSVTALLAPSVPYGVTDFAAGFAGAVSVPADVLTRFLRAIAEGLLADGFAHVCFVNNHLEPAHDAAVRRAVDGLSPRASVACPLTRRWARTLTDEFKSGACHAGRYETSLVLSIAPDRVARDVASPLPAVGISLSDGIRQGYASFREMGIERAYTGAPGEATVEEGASTLELLAVMVVTEVTEAMTAEKPPVLRRSALGEDHAHRPGDAAEQQRHHQRKGHRNHPYVVTSRRSH